MSSKRLTFLQHLEELRARIIKSIILIIVSSALCYAFTDTFLSYLVRPVGRLVFISPQEAFITSIKLALLGGVFLSSPFVVFEIWTFISAGLGNREKRYAALFGFFSFILFILGSLFGYFLIIPIAIRFLFSFATKDLVPMISVDRYVSFVGVLSVAFGVTFQLPLVILFLSKLGIVTPQTLTRKRRYAVLFIFILAAVFTPPDIITQCLMAIPLIILYETGILVSRLSRKKNT